MATSKNTSSSAVAEGAKTFHHGLFKISDGIDLQEKLEQASLFLDTAYEGMDEMVASGSADIRLLWGYVHMIETAKTLVNSAVTDVMKGGAA
jgi:hypothetical protein